MTVSIDDVFAGMTADEVEAQIIALLKNPPAGSGLPPFPDGALGPPTSMGTYFTMTQAQLVSAVTQTIANLAKGGFRTTAGDPSLVLTTGPNAGTSPAADLISQQFYDLERAQRVSTIGGMTLTAASTVGPITKGTGTVTVQDTNGHQYVNIEDFTIPRGGAVTQVSFQATEPGSAWNIANSSTLSFVTALPGVTVSNPGFGSPSTWITQTGADIESDDSLLARDGNQWQVLGTGSPVGAYQNWCFAASAEVRRAFVYGADGTGTVKIRLASNNAGVSPAAVIAVEAYVGERAPLCVSLDIASASTIALTMSAVIYCPAASATAVLNAAVTALKAMIPDVPVGGFSFGATRGVANSMLVETIENANPAITKVIVSCDNGAGLLPNADFLMAEDQVLVTPGTGTIADFGLTTTPA